MSKPDFKKLKQELKKRRKLGKDVTDNTTYNENSLWSYNNNKFAIAGKTCDRLPAGMYKCYITMEGQRIFEQKEVETDQLIQIEDSTSHDIIEEIKEFWKIKDRFTERGFLHKRGFLLSGPPGGGKTATINIVVDTIINQYDGIVIYINDPTTIANCIEDLRKVEPERPIVAVMEDIDDLIHAYGETLFLALLDGEHQINNIVFIATTNNPERLQDRVKKRPSRFDTVVYIQMPDDNMRRTYLQEKEPSLTDKELDRWVRLSDGLSIAHLKEVIILVKCFGKDIEEAVDRLKNFDITVEEQKYQDSKKPRIGFNMHS